MTGASRTRCGLSAAELRVVGDDHTMIDQAALSAMAGALSELAKERGGCREMKFGFTGTRDGLTESQRTVITRLLGEATELHHGCSVGADASATFIMAKHSHDHRIIGYPSTLEDLTDGDAYNLCHETNSRRRPLARNRDIVNACDVLIACPKGPEEIRSGTWTTVRYARKQGKRIVIVWPDGTIAEENSMRGA